jgi:hypothetical protein
VAAGDLSFQATAAQTLAECWLVFAAAAAATARLARRIRRSRRYALEGIVASIIVSAGIATALWTESLQATRLVYESAGEGVRVRPWADVQQHLARTWPLFAGLGVVLLGLISHPRSERAVLALVAAAGVLASWIVAMWLWATSHHQVLTGVLILPGGLGLVASVVGFPVAVALWMAIGRWIWRRHRPRRA